MIKYRNLYLALFLFLMACGSGNETTETQLPEVQLDEEANKTAVELSASENDYAEKYNFVLPSPLQIAAIFQKAGMEYKPDLTHDISKSDQYSTEFQLAMNFGVYSADLSYSVLNGQSQGSIDYMNQVRSLSDKLGLSAIFDTEPLLESFEANVDNRDSIIYILSKLQRNLDLYLEENEARHKSVLYFTGAWIEGMYIGSNSIDLRNKQVISNRLVEQLSLLKNLIKGLSYFPNKTQEYDNLIVELENLRNAMQTISDNGQEDSDGRMNYVMTDDELNNISTIVTALRNQITTV